MAAVFGLEIFSSEGRKQEMIVYEIMTTEKTREFAPAVFLETLGGVYVEVPGNGFFRHPTITTPEALRQHLQQMKREGFRIRKTTRTARAAARKGGK